jgi:hypothetical protein
MIVRRFDRGQFAKATKTPQGFLRVDARVSRTGILEYQQPDGTIRRELRLPEDVFHPDSMGSLKSAPITLDHPGERVTAENAKRYAVGLTGEAVEKDGDFVKTSLLVTDADAIRAIEGGDKRECSVGYDVELDPTPGIYKGQPFDAIQRSIKANHLALVSRGRAGPDVRIHMDRNDAAEMVPTANKPGAYDLVLGNPEKPTAGHPNAGPEQVKSTLDSMRECNDAHVASFAALKHAKDCYDKAPTDATKQHLKDAFGKHNEATKALNDSITRARAEADSRTLDCGKLDTVSSFTTSVFDTPTNVDAELSGASKNDLPDSAFLYVEPGGKKDEDGKTVPRSLRHFPVKNAKGEVDLAHVRNALARIPQSDVSAEVKAKCKAKAEKMLEESKK